ncbi:MAG: hypothetical protein LQ350_002068 [Teloschistes chrysophthalmus]|nr:MAG: hypothetical protein LQ350_002068 [Niorma chrysophthalma]
MSSSVPTVTNTNQPEPSPEYIYIITEFLGIPSATLQPLFESRGVFSSRRHAIYWAGTMMNPRKRSWSAIPREISPRLEEKAAGKEWYSAAIQEDGVLVAVSVDRYPLNRTILGYRTPTGEPPNPSSPNTQKRRFEVAVGIQANKDTREAVALSLSRHSEPKDKRPHNPETVAPAPGEAWSKWSSESDRVGEGEDEAACSDKRYVADDEDEGEDCQFFNL